MAKKGKLRGGRTVIANMGQKAGDRKFTKWMQKMKREHPAEYAEAMRRLEGRE